MVEILELFKGLGLFGVFLSSFVSNLVPYSALPYLAMVAAYSAASPEARLVTVVAGALGATAGKIALYLIARLAGRRLTTGRASRNVELLKKIIGRKSVFLSVLLFAALPLPDDIIYIPLGAIGYSIVYFVIPLLIGKMMIVSFAAFLGARARFLFEYTLEVNPVYLLITIPFMVFVTVEIVLVSLFVDWVKVYESLVNRGGREALRTFAHEAFSVITFRSPSLREWWNRKKPL